MNISENAKLHLYLAWGCPFCHRILAALVVTGLLDKVTITWTKNIKGPKGWEIEPSQDPLFSAQTLKAVYQRLQPASETRYSVPLMVDLQNKSFVSNDSPEIVRFISTGFEGLHRVERIIAPMSLREQIDAKNQWLHDEVNRAVYLVGFATDPSDYETKRARLFKSLQRLNKHLQDHDFLIGDRLTESDLFLFATLERFDAIYYWLFKCNLNRLEDYTYLSDYLKRLREIDGLVDTYNAELTVEHYYLSTMHVRGEVRELNPSKTIPKHVASQR